MPYPTKLHPALERVLHNAERELASNRTKRIYITHALPAGTTITMVGSSDDEDHLYFLLKFRAGGGADDFTDGAGKLLGLYNENVGQIQFGRHIYNSYPAAGKVIVEMLGYLLHGSTNAFIAQVI